MAGERGAPLTGTTGTEERTRGQELRMAVAGVPVTTVTAAATNATTGTISTASYNGFIWSAALSTPGGTFYSFNITNSYVSSDDLVLVSLAGGTQSNAVPGVVTVGSGVMTATVRNGSNTVAFTGSVALAYRVHKTGSWPIP